MDLALLALIIGGVALLLAGLSLVLIYTRSPVTVHPDPELERLREEIQELRVTVNSLQPTKGHDDESSSPQKNPSPLSTADLLPLEEVKIRRRRFSEFSTDSVLEESPLPGLAAQRVPANLKELPPIGSAHKVRTVTPSLLARTLTPSELEIQAALAKPPKPRTLTASELEIEAALGPARATSSPQSLHEPMPMPSFDSASWNR